LPMRGAQDAGCSREVGQLFGSHFRGSASETSVDGKKCGGYHDVSHVTNRIQRVGSNLSVRLGDAWSFRLGGPARGGLAPGGKKAAARGVQEE